MAKDNMKVVELYMEMASDRSKHMTLRFATQDWNAQTAIRNIGHGYFLNEGMIPVSSIVREPKADEKDIIKKSM